MNRNQKLIFENNKGSIEFSLWSSFFLEKVVGLDGIKNNISTSKIFNCDGVICNNNNLNFRNIVLQGSITSNKEENKELLSKIFNPKLSDSKLIWIEGNKQRYINCNIETTPTYSFNTRVSKFQISLLCPNPYWNSVTTNQSELSNFINKFEFPIEFTEDGIEFGGEGKNITIENNGDVETPIKIKFIGEMKNPRLTNKTTNQFIKIEYNLSSKDNLLIDTSLENRKITLNGSNAYGILSLDSTLFLLATGTNEIAFENESNSNAKVILEYNNKFISI